eukprot:scaffold54475_cov69-Phaeocystis_antarctica.AAC.3
MSWTGGKRQMPPGDSALARAPAARRDCRCTRQLSRGARRELPSMRSTPGWPWYASCATLIRAGAGGP